MGNRIKVYLAGKIAPNDWRADIVGAGNLRGADSRNGWGACQFDFGENEVYVGPFFTACDHCCGHGPGTHGAIQPGEPFTCWGKGSERVDELQEEMSVGAEESPSIAEWRRSLFRECVFSIHSADFVFAWLATDDCHGTLFELGVAFGKSKPVYIGVPTGSPPGETWFAKVSAKVITAATAGSAYAVAIRMHKATKAVAELCESPIERLLLAALVAEHFPVFCGDQWRSADLALELKPQFGVSRYRMDFAITGKSVLIGIECDGHEYHEKTKQQAQRDKSRDRILTAAGWRLLRFTGSEINKRPDLCADEIMKVVGSLLHKAS